ncbi:hypothetical protein SAMN05216223_106259 [Actinacidiphila yanglinensis]|uniref:Uncharacterized protein n=1 Tax=Actinacidiphila yanglinensis TaxID=310779 RepID=A0A1H6B710_9ACTN|nr:hypothetical protein [Actinacidiphila yanglinensis]SEG56195.1 hypothetical protein SAMN05216223_106259 [Actinacidiphila yanglinensis]
MASDTRHHRGPEPPRSARPAPTGEPALPVPADREEAPGEALVGDATRSRPIVVVTAIALDEPAREALAQRLGPGHVVQDIREAEPDADIVLVPPAGAMLLGLLRQQFPEARLLATEFTDDGYGADFRGPISRILASDIDGYFMAPTIDDLARVTRSAARAVAGALTAGDGSGPTRPVDFLEANRRLMLGSGGGEGPLPGGDPAQGDVTIDLDAWARALDGSPGILADLAWPLIQQFVAQDVRVTVAGDPPGPWTDRARAAGVRVRPSPRRLDG